MDIYIYIYLCPKRLEIVIVFDFMVTGKGIAIR